MSDSTLGARIAAARNHLGLSQAELAAKDGCGGHAPRIAELEKGRNLNPGLDRVEALAKALDVDLAWLISGDKRHEPPWIEPAESKSTTPGAA